MYKCMSCKSVFEEPRRVQVTDFYGRPEDRPYDECPDSNCRGDYIEEVKQCEYCGGYYTDDEEGFDKCCDKCLARALKELKQIPGDAAKIVRDYIDCL